MKMRQRWLAALALPAVLRAAAAAAAAREVVPPFSRYEIIIARRPFGVATAPPAGPAAADAAATQTQAEQKLAKQIAMVAVNIAPGGRVAVGFIDNGEKPPRNYYLAVGDSANGYTVLDADYEEETATLEKDGVVISLKLGQGLVATTAPATPAAPAAPAAAATAPAQAAARLPSASARTAVTAGVARVRMSPEAMRRALYPEPAANPGMDTSVPGQPIPTSVRLINRMLDSGEITEPSYLERLKKRREELEKRIAAQREINELRQRERAKELGREEFERLVRERNLALIREGLEPVTPIELTPEEDAELVRAGVLPERQ
jgi:hypothetical protein